MNTKNEIPEVDIVVDEKAGVIREIKPEKLASKKANERRSNTIIYVILIIAFTYFYTAITLNPTQMAEDMKRNNGFIPGVKPGEDTANYIEEIMSRLTFPGSLFIAFIAIMPALASLLDVQQAFSQFFGGTSFLILVGVVIDTLQQIQSHLMMRHYDGLLTSGRTRPQNGVSAY